MLAAGGFAASGALLLWQVRTAALTRAAAGDQIGYCAGRLGGAPILDKVAQSPTRGIVTAKTHGVIDAGAAIAVFLTR